MYAALEGLGVLRTMVAEGAAITEAFAIGVISKLTNPADINPHDTTVPIDMKAGRQKGEQGRDGSRAGPPVTVQSGPVRPRPLRGRSMPIPAAELRRRQEVDECDDEDKESDVEHEDNTRCNAECNDQRRPRGVMARSACLKPEKTTKYYKATDK
eukprot:9445798-Pyramimonas_sp.AAC.1